MVATTTSDKYFYLNLMLDRGITANYNVTLLQKTNERDMEWSSGILGTFVWVQWRQRQHYIKLLQHRHGPFKPSPNSAWKCPICLANQLIAPYNTPLSIPQKTFKCLKMFQIDKGSQLHLKQSINNNRITAIEQTAAEVTRDLDIQCICKSIFALDSAVVLVKGTASQHRLNFEKNNYSVNIKK